MEGDQQHTTDTIMEPSMPEPVAPETPKKWYQKFTWWKWLLSALLLILTMVFIKTYMFSSSSKPSEMFSMDRQVMGPHWGDE